jgi:hypothetical protein
MPSPDSLESDPEVLAARGEVELAKAELESRLYQASDSGRRALGRMARKARPVLIAAAVVIGVVVVARLARSVARKRRVRHAIENGQANPSLLRVAFGAALRGAVRVIATRVAEQAAARLALAGEERQLAETPSEGAEWLREDDVEGLAAEVSSVASR